MRRCRTRVFAAVTSFVLVHAACLTPGCRHEGSPAKLQVLCTTTFLGAVTAAIGGAAVDVHTIIPHGMCPGHFELRPGDAEALRRADLLFLHGYERFMRSLVERERTGRETAVVRVDAGGNWLVPDVQRRAARGVTEALTTHLPNRRAALERRLDAYLHDVAEAEHSLAELRASLRGTPVLCSEMISPFVRWLGLEVVDTFGRDEAMSLEALRKSLGLARQHGVRLVIENRQSSGKMGRTLGRELSVPVAVLSNFPALQAPGAGVTPYRRLVTDNADALRAAAIRK